MTCSYRRCGWRIMHELAITEEMLTGAIDAARKAGARRITAIDLVVGDLSTITDDSVQFYVDLLSRGTLAEGAALRFRHEPAICTCQDCAYQAPVTAPPAPICPRCGSGRVQIAGGTAFFVERIEVDDGEPGHPTETQHERADRG